MLFAYMKKYTFNIPIKFILNNVGPTDFKIISKLDDKMCDYLFLLGDFNSGNNLGAWTIFVFFDDIKSKILFGW